MHKLTMFVLVVVLILYLPDLLACEEDTSFGCKPWVTCMPVPAGWDYIKK